jgi:Na+/H+ antiporter NhaC
VDGDGLVKLQSDGSLLSLNYWRDVISSAENNILILAFSAIFGTLLSCSFSFLFVKEPVGKIGYAVLQGLKKGLMPASILVLAWSLKGICTDLNTGPFLAAILGDVIQPWAFPMLLFLTASLVAISTGTSWGTMAILIPTAIPVAFHLDGGTYGLITMISLGAILDGAIMGDHCSPISDTTILSSMSTGCNHMKHVTTQMPYSLLVGFTALSVGYLPAAIGMPVYISYLCAFLLLGGLFVVLKSRRSGA